MSTFSPAGQDAGKTAKSSLEMIQGALRLASVYILSRHRIWGIQVVNRSLSWVNDYDTLGKTKNSIREEQDMPERRLSQRQVRVQGKK